MKETFCYRYTKSSAKHQRSSHSRYSRFNLKMAWHNGSWWPLYVPQWYSPKVSQHFFDPYSFTHILHGVVLYYLWFLLGFRPTVGFFIMFVFEFSWELLENSKSVIERYRKSSGTSAEYKGDSYQNIIGDLIACEVGYTISMLFHRVFGKFWLSAVFFVAVEFGLLLYMRDSLTVTLFTLIVPNESISKWQEKGVEDARKQESKQ